MPYYLIFIFCFFFGNFGAPEQLTDNVLFFKYVCFLSSWYLIITSIFVYVSFRIPPLKKYLYNLLGEKFVFSCIGNPAEAAVKKLLGAGVAMLTGNEFSKYLDGYQKNQMSKCAVQNYIDLCEASGRTPDPRSPEFKKTIDTSTKILNAPAKGFLDRSEERAASVNFVNSTKEVILKGIGWK